MDTGSIRNRLLTDGGEPGEDPSDDPGTGEASDDTFDRFDDTSTAETSTGADEMDERTAAPTADDPDAADDSDAADDPDASDDPDAADDPDASDDSDAADDPDASDEPAQAGTGEETTGQPAANDDNDSVLAALVSFFLIPGVGHMMVDGKKDRGVSILLFYIVWLVVGWGVFAGGIFILFGIIMAVTFGFGGVLFLLYPIVLLFVGIGELLIRVFSAIDAYQHSEYMDTVTQTVNEYR